MLVADDWPSLLKKQERMADRPRWKRFSYSGGFFLTVGWYQRRRNDGRQPKVEINPIKNGKKKEEEEMTKILVALDF